MARQWLSQAPGGDVWIYTEDEADTSATCLGEPSTRLYDRVPQELWPELEAIIAADEDGVRFDRAIRQEAESTYRRESL
jgi:hypothetical protein